MKTEHLEDLAFWIYENLDVEVNFHMEDDWYEGEMGENGVLDGYKIKTPIVDDIVDFPIIFSDINTQNELEEIYTRIFLENINSKE